MLRWEVHKKDEQQCINIVSLVEVPNPMGGGGWICADYNIINYKQGNEYIGLPGSYYTLFEEDQYGGFKRELTSINI